MFANIFFPIVKCEYKDVMEMISKWDCVKMEIIIKANDEVNLPDFK